jgi:hypothetical protein
MCPTGLDRNRFMRDDPERMARSLIHLHWKAHGRANSANAARLELRGDLRPDLVDLVARSMEFEIGDRSRRATDWLAGHAQDEAEKRLGPRIIAKDLVALRIEAGAGGLDETGIISDTI